MYQCTVPFITEADRSLECIYLHVRELAGSLVLAWYLFGVFAQQETPAIHWSALGLGVVVVLYTLKPFVARLVGRRSSGESAPLLG